MTTDFSELNRTALISTCDELYAKLDKAHEEIANLKQIPACLGPYKILQAENERLKEFARPVIETECWSLSEQDGGYLQELAEKLELIVSYTVTEEDADDDYGVGETKCKFSDTLKESDK